MPQRCSKAGIDLWHAVDERRHHGPTRSRARSTLLAINVGADCSFPIAQVRVEIDCCGGLDRNQWNCPTPGLPGWLGFRRFSGVAAPLVALTALPSLFNAPWMTPRAARSDGR